MQSFILATIFLILLGFHVVANAQTQEQKAKAMVELLAEQQREAERRAIDKAKSDLIKEQSSSRDSDVLAPFIFAVLVLALGAVLYTLYENAKISKAAEQKRVNALHQLEEQRRSAESVGIKIPTIESLGKKIATMTVAEIGEKMMISPRAVRVRLYKRGVSCIDYDGATALANAKKRGDL